MKFQHRLIALLLSCAGMLVAASAWAQSNAAREATIKAVLILKMVKFVDWPADLAQPGDAMQMCAWGDSPVGALLATLNTAPVRGRPVKFRKVVALTLAELKGCHVLYLPDGAREGNAGVQLAGPRMRGLLTISDAPNFIHRMGMVGLVRNDNKVSFEINLTLAREEGLQPSAQLLELATLVE